MKLHEYQVVLAVAGFILTPEQEVLIIHKSAAERIDANLWTVPGGKVKPHEGIGTALKREIKEEVGITFDTFRWIGEDVFPVNKVYFHAQHFLIHLPKKPVIRLEKKLLEYRYIKKQEIERYEFHPNIRTRLGELL